MHGMENILLHDYDDNFISYIHTYTNMMMITVDDHVEDDHY